MRLHEGHERNQHDIRQAEDDHAGSAAAFKRKGFLAPHNWHADESRRDGVTSRDGWSARVPVGNARGSTPGREYDSESGLYFYRARTYDPGTGRFLQRDPLGFADGLGLHEYAGSRPLVLVDPSGTEDEDESERREDEKDQAKENIEKALAVILKHGPDWAKELLKNLRRRMNIYGLHGMTGAHGLCRRVPHPEGGYGYLIPIAIGGPAGKALLEKGWLGLIRTLLHELRHVYLYEKNRQPTEGSNEDKHPMVPEHGMPESPPQDDPETEEDEGKSKVDVWRDTDKKEADETVRRAEEAAAKEGGSPTPWETGKAGEGAAGVGAPSDRRLRSQVLATAWRPFGVDYLWQSLSLRSSLQSSLST